MSMAPIFRSPLAGRWYSADPGELRRELEAFRPVPGPPPDAGVCAVVVPHAGYAYSGRVAASVYARLDPSAYDRVVVMGPSHHVPLRHCVSVHSSSGFQTPLGTSPADTAWLRRILSLGDAVTIKGAHAQEHSTQIQIPMIQHYLGVEKRLVCVVAGWFDETSRVRFASHLRTLLDERTLVVASTDFTHYGPQFGYLPFPESGPGAVAENLAALDGAVFEAFASWNGVRLAKVLDETGATVCGREVLSLLLALRPEGGAVVRTGYATSGALLGDWTNSVSYVGALVRGSWGAMQCTTRAS